jgi:large subunit ribosomal protein L21
MLAVIKTGGKQYKVSKGDKIKIEKLNAKEGDEIVFDNVLLVEKNKSSTSKKVLDKKTEVGNPLVKNAKVKGKVLKQGRARKVEILKHKAKKRYNLKKGHRQFYTEVEIIEIK